MSSMTRVYIQCYFVTIACILGSGILGLPVTLSHAGLYPFLVSFFVCAVIQTLLTVLFTDLLQKASVLQSQLPCTKTEETVLLNDLSDEDTVYEVENSGIPVAKDNVAEIPSDILMKSVNFHALGKLFLVAGVSHFYDIFIILSFIAFLISYALAGSEAYAQLMGIDYFYVIPVFVWVLSFIVIFGLKFIEPFVSFLTFVKVSLFIGTVIITLMVGSSGHRKITNDFTSIGPPFLMGTVALSGAVTIMPFLFEKIHFSRRQVMFYNVAIILGLYTCFITNILWCWAVLDIVPQLTVEHCNAKSGNTTKYTSMKMSSKSVVPTLLCYNNVSLQRSESIGEISTIPLTKIILEDYPSYGWIAILVQLFITISITVSYLINATALHHTLCGVSDSLFAKEKPYSCHALSEKCLQKSSLLNFILYDSFSSNWICKMLISTLMFGLVFVVAIVNPEGFVDVLEKFGAFIMGALYLFISAMIFVGILKHRNLKIPFPLPNAVYYLHLLVPLYFGFILVYSVYLTIKHLVEKPDTINGTP